MPNDHITDVGTRSYPQNINRAPFGYLRAKLGKKQKEAEEHVQEFKKVVEQCQSFTTPPPKRKRRILWNAHAMKGNNTEEERWRKVYDQLETLISWCPNAERKKILTAMILHTVPDEAADLKARQLSQDCTNAIVPKACKLIFDAFDEKLIPASGLLNELKTLLPENIDLLDPSTGQPLPRRARTREERASEIWDLIILPCLREGHSACFKFKPGDSWTVAKQCDAALKLLDKLIVPNTGVPIGTLPSTPVPAAAEVSTGIMPIQQSAHNHQPPPEKHLSPSSTYTRVMHMKEIATALDEVSAANGRYDGRAVRRMLRKALIKVKKNRKEYHREQFKVDLSKIREPEHMVKLKNYLDKNLEMPDKRHNKRGKKPHHQSAPKNRRPGMIALPSEGDREVTTGKNLGHFAFAVPRPLWISENRIYHRSLTWYPSGRVRRFPTRIGRA